MRLLLVSFFTILISSFGFSQEEYVAQQRIEVQDKGISIIPPIDWEIKNDVPGATLFFQAPMEDGDVYQRNIRIMSFKGPQYLDDVSFEAFANHIKENSSKMSNSLRNYQIRDLTAVDLAEDIKGGLFYADFTLSKVPMMQMHILVSSADNHFLMTYTDVRERFEDSTNGLLDEAYQSMQTILLDSKPPARTDFAVKIGIAVAATIILFFVVAIIRKRRVNQLGHDLDEYDEDSDGDDDSDDDDWSSSEGNDDGDGWGEGDDSEESESGDESDDELDGDEELEKKAKKPEKKKKEKKEKKKKSKKNKYELDEEDLEEDEEEKSSDGWNVS